MELTTAAITSKSAIVFGLVLFELCAAAASPCTKVAIVAIFVLTLRCSRKKLFPRGKSSEWQFGNETLA
jgi:hypothetical protein